MFGSVSREPKDHKHKIKGCNKPIHVQISNPAAQAQPPMPIPAENPAPNPAPIPAQEDLPPVPHRLVLPHLAPVHAEYNVTTLIPSPDESCNTIVLTGQLANVTKAKQSILHYVGEPQDKKPEQGYLKNELVSQQNEHISSLQKQILELSSQYRNLKENVKTKIVLSKWPILIITNFLD